MNDIEAVEAALLGAQVRKAVDAAPQAFLLTKDGFAKGDVPGHEFHGNQYVTDSTGQKQDATPGGKTEYLVTTTTTSGRPEKEGKAKAFLHANALKTAGHQDVKVTRRYVAHTIPGRGVGGTTTFTVHHGTKLGVSKNDVPTHLQLCKGDAPGHEFHGNQYSGGGGKETPAPMHASKAAAMRYHQAEADKHGGETVGRYGTDKGTTNKHAEVSHRYAMEALKDYGLQSSQYKNAAQIAHRDSQITGQVKKGDVPKHLQLAAKG